MSDPASPSVVPCPICGKPRVDQFRLFCSKRCADVDLNRWLKGVYAVPVTENDDEDGEQGQSSRAVGALAEPPFPGSAILLSLRLRRGQSVMAWSYGPGRTRCLIAGAS